MVYPRILERGRRPPVEGLEGPGTPRSRQVSGDSQGRDDADRRVSPTPSDKGFRAEGGVGNPARWGSCRFLRPQNIR
jgi:hypothetical protein